MHHLAAYYGSVAASQNETLVNPVQDGALSIQNNRLVMPSRTTIRRAYGMGAGLLDMRVSAPSLRTLAYPYIAPVDKNATPSVDPPTTDWWERGPVIMQSEGVGIQATTDATAGPNNTIALLWLYGAYSPAPPGQIVTVKATSNCVAALGTWGQGTLTLLTDLPAGRYSIVGAAVSGTNVAAARYRFPGQGWLPGVICNPLLGGHLTDEQRFGGLGNFGQFDNYNLPNVEVLGLGATATQTHYLDLVRVG